MATPNGDTNGGPLSSSSSSAPKIIFYTNPECPYAQRVNITLRELGLEFETVVISLDEARPAWYLKINPRGLVPALSYNDEIILESSIISYFLADSHPSHLLPPSSYRPASGPSGALTRARIAFFVDTFMSKIQPLTFAVFRALPRPSSSSTNGTTTTTTGDSGSGGGDDGGTTDSPTSHPEFVAAGTALVQAMATHIDPLLADAAPFFGGSDRFTLAEALLASFVIRFGAMIRGGMFPASVEEGLAELENYSRWAGAVVARDSVRDGWDEGRVIAGTRKRLDKFRRA